MFTVYVLVSKTTGMRYVGQTSNLPQRLVAHNNGDSRYTKNRGPWKLIYSERYTTRTEAIIREKYLKTGKGREFLSSLTK